VEQISFKRGAVNVMTTTKTYDPLNLLLSVGSVPSGSSAVNFGYSHNYANHCTLRREADGGYWRYEYDALGQVTSGNKYWADGTPVAGQQFQYGFDDIGNRLSTKAGGDENGANFRTNVYYPNLLNQYTSRTVPGAADVIGVSLATNTVTVNSLVPYRKGEYFRKELTVANSSAPVWQAITVAANGQTSVSGNTWVPRTPEAFGYDSDGNLTNDGRWAYTWDAENRLHTMVPNTAIGPQSKLAFDYDARGRRIRKQVWNNAAGTGNPTNDLRFVYDGWNLIGTLNSALSLVNSYTWGLDLSGSLQGAGGVGGLLVASEISNGVVLNSYLPAFDGNGNVAALVKAGDGTESARYEHGPFGEVIRATGPMAKANPFRFSTKYQDDETDLLYYGYRYYNASTGRWLSRDPIGGLNCYAFVVNESICDIDLFGLSAISTVRQKLLVAGMRTIPSDMVKTTHFPDALSRFSQLVARINAKYGNPGRGKGALWLIHKNTMVIADDAVAPDTIVHEMTHAVQDVELGWSFANERVEEGQAYAMESFYRVSERLKLDESKLERAGCNPGVVLGVWQTFWRQYGVLPSEDWGKVSWSEGSEPLNKQDIWGINVTFGVKLSCQALAVVVNSILADYHCCVSVKCSGSDTSGEISPGITIDSDFQ